MRVLRKVATTQLLMIMCFFAVATNASAAQYTLTGTVNATQSQDVNIGTYFPGAGPGDVLYVNGGTVGGNCLKNGTTGLVAVEVKNDVPGKRQFLMAMVAQVTGKTVVVGVDDTYRDTNGICYAIYLKMQ